MSDSCDLIDCSLPGSSIHGILQARILEWVAISFSKGSSRPRNRTWVSCIAGQFFTDRAIREAFFWKTSWSQYEAKSHLRMSNVYKFHTLTMIEYILKIIIMLMMTLFVNTGELGFFPYMIVLMVLY